MQPHGGFWNGEILQFLPQAPDRLRIMFEDLHVWILIEIADSAVTNQCSLRFCVWWMALINKEFKEILYLHIDTQLALKGVQLLLLESYLS